MSDGLARLMDPYEAAAARIQQSVRGGRKEGALTRLLDGAGTGLYNMAASPSRLVNAHMGEYHPGASVQDMPQTMEQLPEVAMNVTGIPGGQGGLGSGARTAADTTHLNALQLRLSHERDYLNRAKTDQERQLRQVWIGQIEKEIGQEKKFLGIKDADPINISDDDLLAELMK